MIDSEHLANLSATTTMLFERSSSIFWAALPVALLVALLILYVGGEMSGGKLGSLFRRLIVAIALLVAFPEISQAIQALEAYLVGAFGGDASLAQVFLQVGAKVSHMKDGGFFNWLKVGQIGLNIITTLSFLILALVRHFLDMLHLSLWNLLHVLGPISLLGCLFVSFTQVPKGIFTGMLELALWKPVWVVLARLLLAAGFGEEPKDVSQWFDTAVLNFAVAGLMASTPILVHAFLGGTIASFGGAVIQTMASGTGAVLAAQPMRVIQGGAQLAYRTANQHTQTAISHAANRITRHFKPNSNPKKTR